MRDKGLDSQATSNFGKKIALFILIFFLVGNVSFYLNERSKWIYEGQPYPNAKEWLVPANMMLVYGTTLTKLPFIDERSFIMKPVVSLQDFFVSKWEKNLPDDDAEKYLGWYIFKLRTYVIPNVNSVILYSNNVYSYDETRNINDKAWKTLEKIIELDAKDKVFENIKIKAILNLSFLYVENSSVYWCKKDTFSFDEIQADKRCVFDSLMMATDNEKKSRFIQLYQYFDDKRSEQYRQSFKNLENDTKMLDTLKYNLTDYLLRYKLFDLNKKLIKKNDFCDVNKNDLLKIHMKSKKKLIEFYKTGSESRKKSVKRDFQDSTDNKINKICKDNKNG